MLLIETPIKFARTDSPSKSVQPLVEVNGLSVTYRHRRAPPQWALKGVSLRIQPGEVVGVLGESGSGKTTLALALAGLLPANAEVVNGSAEYLGRDLLRLGENEIRKIRGGQIAFVFQEPATALNPVMRVGDQISEVLLAHRSYPRESRRSIARDILGAAGLPDVTRAYSAYPHELSGGEQQRVAIGQALACRPQLLIGDEAMSSLDPQTKMEMLQYLKDAKHHSGTAMLMITHDPFTLEGLAERVLILSQGELVREASLGQVLERPVHLFASALLSAIMPPNEPRIPASPETGSARRQEVAPSRAAAGWKTRTVLTAKDVSKTYARGGWLTGRRKLETPALSHVSLRLVASRTTGLIGESGSGKSTLARCLAGLETPDSGVIRLESPDPARPSRREMRDRRRAVQLVVQNTDAAFNPWLTIEETLAEPLKLRRLPRAAQRERAADLMEQVGLPQSWRGRRPRELSGGQRHRLAIARALAADPQVVIFDEALSGLDVPVQAQMCELMLRLQERLSLAYLFITHDVHVAGYITDDIMVMRSGRVVEWASTLDVYTKPACCYTRSFLSSVTAPQDPD